MEMCIEDPLLEMGEKLGVFVVGSSMKEGELISDDARRLRIKVVDDKRINRDDRDFELHDSNDGALKFEMDNANCDSEELDGGGLLLMWKAILEVSIESSLRFHIDSIIRNTNGLLEHSGDSLHGPWICGGDMNEILSNSKSRVNIVQYGDETWYEEVECEMVVKEKWNYGISCVTPTMLKAKNMRCMQMFAWVEYC
ncbi:hypothetical protein G4B88_021156 [Cannabis sativa]|uniref:Uncharacterized protein n=1 Tax=Cannabis sativa TaxID=3483 RepID=A0A7J6HXF2_CANSA|nr:hypothetical protein G4B88_021156 [Cannabis sativa]